MLKRQKPQIINTQIVATSRLFNIEQVQLKFSNNEERTYERMLGNRQGAVMIVPVHQGNFLLAREYAVGTDCYELGFPKGLIDKGETPAQAADRELQEEIGFKAQNLSLLKEVSLAPGYFSSKMQIFIAENLISSWLEGDEPEPIEIVSWPIGNWEELLTREDFSESRSINALFLAQKHLQIK